MRALSSALLFMFAFTAALPAQLFPGHPVENLGGGLAGISGIPTMAVDGMLAPGETVVFTLDNAAPNSVAVLVVGLTIINLPIFGGVLIPNPEVLTSTTTDATGHAEVAFTWNEDLMLTTFWQWGVIDAAAVEGWSISNALAVTGNTWDLKDGGISWGKLWQSTNRLSIKVTKNNGSTTTWTWDANTSSYTDGQGNQLQVSSTGGSIQITGGQHQGAYSVH